MPFRFLNLEYFFQRIYDFLTSGAGASSIPTLLVGIIFWIKIVSLLITPLFLALVVILMIKINRLRDQESEEVHSTLHHPHHAPPAKNEHWEKVLHYLASDNPAEWKLAVLEADNILDEVIKHLRTVGENLGERLKSIAPGELLTLDDAWEAHKTRNQVAHETNFILTKPVARQTIERYKRVFEELEYL